MRHCTVLSIGQKQMCWSALQSWSAPLFSHMQNVGVLMTQLIRKAFEPPHEKTNNLHMRKQTQISFAITAKLISAFVFTSRRVHFLFFLNPKFPASSLLLWLYSLICVGPVRKPHCWFSHETAHLELPQLVEDCCLINIWALAWENQLSGFSYRSHTNQAV